MNFSEEIYILLGELQTPIDTISSSQLVYGGLQLGALLVIVFLLAFNTVRRKR